MSGLPNGWVKAKLGGLYSADGLFTDGDWIESKDQDPNGENRLLQLADIGDGFFIDKSSRFVNNEKFSALNCTAINEGDVLIARMPDPLGRACLAPKMPQRCLTVVDVAIFRTGKAGVLNKWLMNWINSPVVRAYIDVNSSGTTRKRISKGNLIAMELPVPPLPEQKRIADKLDATLARVDACRERLARVTPLLKRFRQSVLAAATSGQLTADWREKQGYSHLGIDNKELQGYTNVHNVGWSDEERPISAVHDESWAPTPDGWRQKELSELCHSITDGDHQAPPQAKTGIPFITISAINDGFLRLEKASRYVPIEYFEQLKDSRKPSRGDILFSVTGSICMPALVEKNTNFTFQRHIAILKTNTELISSKFLYFVLSSEDIKKQGLAVATGTAQLTVSLKGLRAFQIRLPSLNEQTEIVRRVETLFAFADRLEARLANASKASDRLTPSLLATAFRGELTAKWREANPDLISGENSVQELLNKINAERIAIQNQPKPKRISVKKKSGTNMSKQIISVVDALRQAGGPLSGQQLLAAAGYPSNSGTEVLELFFLAIREALISDKTIVLQKRDDDGQDWFSLADANLPR